MPGVPGSVYCTTSIALPLPGSFLAAIVLSGFLPKACCASALVMPILRDDVLRDLFASIMAAQEVNDKAAEPKSIVLRN